MCAPSRAQAIAAALRGGGGVELERHHRSREARQKQVTAENTERLRQQLVEGARELGVQRQLLGWASLGLDADASRQLQTLTFGPVEGSTAEVDGTGRSGSDTPVGQAAPASPTSAGARAKELVVGEADPTDGGIALGGVSAPQAFPRRPQAGRAGPDALTSRCGAVTCTQVDLTSRAVASLLRYMAMSPPGQQQEHTARTLVDIGIVRAFYQAQSEGVSLSDFEPQSAGLLRLQVCFASHAQFPLIVEGFPSSVERAHALARVRVRTTYLHTL
eukprot:COSAG01_NODE_3615_length_5864_cov_26.705984_9_plen_274_part_00